MGNGWCVSPRWQGPRDGKIDSKVNNLKKKKCCSEKNFQLLCQIEGKSINVIFFFKERYFC